MSLPALLEVAIGLILVFLIFSLIVSGAQQAVARVFSWRSKQLWAAIHKLVDDSEPPVASKATARTGKRLVDATPVGDVRPEATPETPSRADQLYAHPFVAGFEQISTGARTKIDNIEASAFSRALVDVLVPDGDGNTSVDVFKERVRGLPAGSPLRRVLLELVSEAAGTLDSLHTKIGGWFDRQMEGLSRAYKRRATWWSLAFAIVVAVGFNVDAVHVTQRLFRDDALRTAAAEAGEQIGKACAEKEDDELDKCLEDEGKKADDELTLPVGWGEAKDGRDFSPYWILGWALSAFALMQGAPFWFDILRRATRGRSGTSNQN